ncbi:MAG: sigma-70 family RNA polymerase sigma factor [Acetivibrionales bacterium]|jgi:RNA polymerase sigma factor (sigma-70 family)|nr:sigma-70 family RNA polymerase sigma factor [Bacillota bacterium]NLP07897.1 sigma-70 family RNA polymerase sigma factor [Clostridiaceae bacterium]HOA54414.1 sigma-70 family RNA polymerase sigma factor [Clostridiales bacterium]HPZ05068.1 sigma-70 family RNA polymerase sigma factor [Clostridiales bacterium]HQD30393.1 sigma-70 family RNA polymerase sigma factor [Clostridiales bacterium]
MKRTDSELVKSCLLGNNDAFAELISRYKRLIYSVAYKFTKESEEADDMAQEAFIKIYRSLSRYNDQYKFSTWCVKVATNICLDHVRRRKLNCVSLDEIESFTGSDTDTPEEHYLRKERCQVVQDAIDSLPEIYKEPIVMYHQKGMSYKEIAEDLGKPMSIIKNRIFRARHALRENLSTAVS